MLVGLQDGCKSPQGAVGVLYQILHECTSHKARSLFP